MATTVGNFRSQSDRNDQLCVKEQIQNLRRTGSISDLRQSSRPLTNRSWEDVDAVPENIADSPGISTPSSGIGHLERFAYSCLQSSIKSITEGNH